MTIESYARRVEARIYTSLREREDVTNEPSDHLSPAVMELCRRQCKLNYFSIRQERSESRAVAGQVQLPAQWQSAGMLLPRR